MEGAKALSEMLKVNASIKVLDMKCDDERYDKRKMHNTLFIRGQTIYLETQQNRC